MFRSSTIVTEKERDFFLDFIWVNALPGLEPQLLHASEGRIRVLEPDEVAKCGHLLARQSLVPDQDMRLFVGKSRIDAVLYDLPRQPRLRRKPSSSKRVPTSCRPNAVVRILLDEEPPRIGCPLTFLLH